LLIIYDKAFSKTDNCTQSLLKKSYKKLEQRALSYFNKNIQMDQIYGDDILIHDVIDGMFYVYKTRINTLQIRVLYTVDERNNIIIIAHHIKKNNTKYFSYFENCVKEYIGSSKKII
jgi:mRNA-degrading endonuclease RelE of RelBE toxin-antitoxin system